MCIAGNVSVSVHEIICSSGRELKINPDFFSFHAALGHNLHSIHMIFSKSVDILVLSLTMCSENQRDLENLN